MPKLAPFKYATLCCFLLTLSIYACSSQNEDTNIAEEEPSTEIKEVFTVVEDMPRFPGCEDMGLSKDELRACAKEKMNDFVNANLIYPQEAIDNGIEGTVVVRFIVDTVGHLQEPELLQDLEYGTGEEVLRIINIMPVFIPGKQRGRPVFTYYNLPVVFAL